MWGSADTFAISSFLWRCVTAVDLARGGSGLEVLVVDSIGTSEDSATCSEDGERTGVSVFEAALRGRDVFIFREEAFAGAAAAAPLDAVAKAEGSIAFFFVM
jgi:hypothetical protein